MDNVCGERLNCNAKSVEWESSPDPREASAAVPTVEGAAQQPLISHGAQIAPGEDDSG